MKWDITISYKGKEVVFADIQGTNKDDAIQRVMFWVGGGILKNVFLSGKG